VLSAVAAVEDNIALGLWVVLQLIGEIIQPGLLIFTSYIPELIELTGFGMRGARMSISHNCAEDHYE
jgi:hypothetical protein